LDTIKVLMYKFRVTKIWMILVLATKFYNIVHSQNPSKYHKAGSNQRLNRAEAKDRNHVKKAMAADI